MSQLVPRGPSSLDTYDYCEANMYDWSKSDKGLILPLESFGLPPGVQTTTTPTLTLTPTTMRSFAADLLNGALDDEQTPYHNEAGFVPPVVHTSSSLSTYVVDSKSWQGGSVTTMPAASAANTASAVATSNGTVPVAASVAASTVLTALTAPVLAESPPLPSTTPTPSRRNVGGRRPNKSSGISPEEEERRQMRRERNKAAAARCRKRRLDQTNTLVIETEGLECKKRGLQNEIQQLTNEVKELEFLLETHVCRLPRSERCASPLDIKPTIYDLKQEEAEHNELREPPMKRPMMSMPAPPVAPAVATPVQSKPSRPTSLPVSSHNIFRSTAAEIAGISITTPSTGIMLNFDSLMEGGTGLTPVSGPLVPSCSSQQRNQNCVDLSSPDSNITNKLVSL
ncbi:transcription factor kayak, isoforms D/sro isoform X2 [Thrips palmi]|uniref:Transcription factor kayak, isoforms D/sro isoform X2 n=1 Tax=Thrips palmi TaxID=161013 RepID=A0A6P9A0L4_THRPL|nr:transcription factor kayak, isoforms D/sro isoform X2 [Thrips palmi]